MLNDISIVLGIFLVLSLIITLWLFINKTKNEREYKTLQALNQQLEIQLYSYKNKAQQQEQLLEYKTSLYDELKTEINQLRAKFDEYNQQLIQKESKISQLQTALEDQEQYFQQQIETKKEDALKLQQQFELLAKNILESNTKQFKEQSHEQLQNILAPVKQQMESFRKKVEDVYDKESKDRTLLYAEIGQLKKLNLQLQEDAVNLTNALKGSTKQQGIWGEMVLQRVLENSGLRKDHEYFTEVVLKDDSNTTYRPDVLIKLPDNRDIIIDAKTSLIAYEQYLSSQDETHKHSHLNALLTSINTHIDQLSNKNYERLQGINSLDFIFMFIPIESALMVAMEKDIHLFDKAFKKKIVLVSPTTLLVALKAVENTWRYERQAQNIQEVTKRAEDLYTKFVSFTEDLNKVENSLNKAQESFQEAKKKLSSGKFNLIRQAEIFKEKANITPKKNICENLLEEANQIE